MAMKALIEGECGGANPLMRFANHLVPDGKNIPAQLSKDRNQLVPIYRSKNIQDVTGQELADEFLSASNSVYQTVPSTFNMHQLLQEIQQQQPSQFPQKLSQPQQQQPPMLQLHHNNTTDSFELEFQMHQQHTAILNEAHDWSEEFKPQPIESSLGGAWGWQKEWEGHKEGLFEDAFNQPSPLIQLDTYEEEEGGVVVKEQQQRSQLSDDSLMPPTEAEEWAAEFRGQGHQDVWNDLLEKWSGFAEGWQGGDKWVNDFSNFSLNDVFKDYKFEECNDLVMDRGEALSEGVRRMNEGDVANAVLFLETAVKQDPTNAMAWFHLGTSQADNEQDPLAIAAFHKCLELDPNNLAAMQSLAVAYTNEGFPSKAYEHLLAWISSNQKYKGLVESSSPPLRVEKLSHTNVLDLFMRAVQADATNIDPDLQSCLGVIFNLSGEFSKAVDCFRTALQVAPRNSMLWNKLGATLANGQMSEQSVSAYRNALSLRPGYVRTRFNLGVACVNLGAYRESIDHFLSALKLQGKSKGPSSSSPSASLSSPISSNIWQSLRLSLSLFGRNDLLQACDDFDVARLLDEFNV